MVTVFLNAHGQKKFDKDYLNYQVQLIIRIK